jgi:hypothetical protein
MMEGRDQGTTTIPDRGVRWLGGLLAALGWAALVTQMTISVGRAIDDGRGAIAGLVNYFSYFTILTNLLVAVTLTSQAAAPGSRVARFLGRPGVLTAIAAYIAVVGVAYHVLLADLYHPTGIARVTDTVFHSVMPTLFLGYWWLAVPGGQLPRLGPPAWAAYPLAYFVYLLARGALTGVYPYPFADPSQLGYPRAMLNGLGILGSILFTGAVLTAAKRAKAGDGPAA